MSKQLCYDAMGLDILKFYVMSYNIMNVMPDIVEDVLCNVMSCDVM